MKWREVQPGDAMLVWEISGSGKSVYTVMKIEPHESPTRIMLTFLTSNLLVKYDFSLDSDVGFEVWCKVRPPRRKMGAS